MTANHVIQVNNPSFGKDRNESKNCGRSSRKKIQNYVLSLLETRAVHSFLPSFTVGRIINTRIQADISARESLGGKLLPIIYLPYYSMIKYDTRANGWPNFSLELETRETATCLFVVDPARRRLRPVLEQPLGSFQ